MTDPRPDGERRAAPEGVTRREMLAATAAALTTPLLPIGRPVPVAAPGAPAGRPLFLTEHEFALLDELSELIIPTDAQSPGARAAQVAAYLDARLAESFEPEWPALWRAGLQAVEDLSRERLGKGFLEASPDQRIALLGEMAAGERDPKTPAQRFFRDLKGGTAHAYYTSKIGIHVDQQYKGNVYQEGEYAGYDAT
ncbi:MAG TPA: gluconate 2-dehydrogenase subunit 3 family protein [Gemmatimonadales bacterium]|nr:gluconate 2-dehydrogenase subunit 3 family protein [Gemmatimonadales bacterium]